MLEETNKLWKLADRRTGMNILICDDERFAAEKIAELVSRSAVQHHLPVSVVKYTDVEKCLASPLNRCDIAFFDIDMKPYNGIDLARKLHNENPNAIIFLSLAVTLLSLHIVPLLNFITALILMFVGSSIILAIAPTNSPQMHLTETEMTAMRKHVRTRLLILTILFLLFVFVNMEKAYCIAVAVAVVAISLLTVRRKSQ